MQIVNTAITTRTIILFIDESRHVVELCKNKSFIIYSSVEIIMSTCSLKQWIGCHVWLLYVL